MAGLRKAARIIHTVDREMNLVNENGKVAGYRWQVSGYRLQMAVNTNQPIPTYHLPPVTCHLIRR
jgi:hypothetical protein